MKNLYFRETDLSDIISEDIAKILMTYHLSEAGFKKCKES